MSMSKDISREPLSSLFKDGIYEDLFKLLWSKDELNYGPQINMPDTIVYKYGQPQSWYFTAVNGRIKKKNKQNLVSAKIEEVFNKHVLGYDVLAYFISVPVEQDQEQNAGPITIEYLDRSALNDFLYKRKKEVNGLLQRFIEPKTTRNEVIRAIWSPKVCLLERAENIHQLHDHRYGLYERCVIYEGPEYYFTSAPLRGPVLSGQIQKLCESVISHISEVTFGQKAVSRIVLNFKVDSRDKIWLLYSTSTRCIDMLEQNNFSKSSTMKDRRSLVNIDSVISLSNTVHLNPQKSYKSIVPKNRIRCLSCAKESLEDMRHPITYKTIVKHYDHVLHLLASESTSSRKKESIPWPPDADIVDATGGVNFGCIYMNENGEMLNQREIEHLMKLKLVKDLAVPPIIQSVHSKLTVKSYLQCKNDPLFLYKTVHVCEPCYLVFAEFTTLLLKMGGDLTKLLTPDPVGESHLFDLSSSHAGDSTSHTGTRASEAEWRAIGASSKASMSMSKSHKGGQSANSRKAKENSIGLRTSDTRRQPFVPKPIRGPGEADMQSYIGGLDGGPSQHTSSSTINTNELDSVHSGDQRSVIGVSGPGSVYGQTDDIREMIADRERHFFKEIALNPQLKDQHPLMHLISTQQKLKLIDEESGVLKSKKASRSESAFGSNYGKQTDDNYSRLGMYSMEQPYCVGGEIILPSKLRLRKAQEKEQRAREKRIRKASFRLEAADDNDTRSVEGGSVGTEQVSRTSSARREELEQARARSAGDPNISASTSHRSFLKDQLQQLELDVNEGMEAERFVSDNEKRDLEAAANRASNIAKGEQQKGKKPELKKVDWAELASKLPTGKDQIQERRDLFSKFDRNDNGHLSLDEVASAIRDHLHLYDLFHAKDVIIKAFDIAKNACPPGPPIILNGIVRPRLVESMIELREFRVFLVALRIRFEYWTAFQCLDKNGDGFISLSEFKQCRHLVEQWVGPIKNIEREFASLDKQNRGKIDFDVFISWSVKKDMDIVQEEGLGLTNATLKEAIDMAQPKEDL